MALWSCFYTYSEPFLPSFSSGMIIQCYSAYFNGNLNQNNLYYAPQLKAYEIIEIKG
jgi:hypothetical protein